MKTLITICMYMFLIMTGTSALLLLPAEQRALGMVIFNSTLTIFWTILWAIIQIKEKN